MSQMSASSNTSSDALAAATLAELTTAASTVRVVREPSASALVPQDPADRSAAPQDVAPTLENAAQEEPAAAVSAISQVSRHTDPSSEAEPPVMPLGDDDTDEGRTAVAEVHCSGHSTSGDVQECVDAASESCADDGDGGRADGSGACEEAAAALPAPSSAANDGELGAPSAKKLRVEPCPDACAEDLSA